MQLVLNSKCHSRPQQTSNEFPTTIYSYAIIKMNENLDAFVSVVTSVKIQSGASVNQVPITMASWKSEMNMCIMYGTGVNKFAKQHRHKRSRWLDLCLNWDDQLYLSIIF